MKILLTGATGYIGKRLLPILIEMGHEVVCCVRDKNRFPTEGIYSNSKISLLEVDFLKELPSSEVIKDIDAGILPHPLYECGNRRFRRNGGYLQLTNFSNWSNPLRLNK